MLLSSSHLLATHDCQLGVTVGNRRFCTFGCRRLTAPLHSFCCVLCSESLGERHALDCDVASGAVAPPAVPRRALDPILARLIRAAALMNSDGTYGTPDEERAEPHRSYRGWSVEDEAAASTPAPSPVPTPAPTPASAPAPGAWWGHGPAPSPTAAPTPATDPGGSSDVEVVPGPDGPVVELVDVADDGSDSDIADSASDDDNEGVVDNSDVKVVGGIDAAPPPVVQTMNRAALPDGLVGSVASACSTVGWCRPSRIRYLDRRTLTAAMVCCLECCCNVNDENTGGNGHSFECNATEATRQRRRSSGGGSGSGSSSGPQLPPAPAPAPASAPASSSSPDPLGATDASASSSVEHAVLTFAVPVAWADGVPQFLAGIKDAALSAFVASGTAARASVLSHVGSVFSAASPSAVVPVTFLVDDLKWCRVIAVPLLDYRDSVPLTVPASVPPEQRSSFRPRNINISPDFFSIEVAWWPMILHHLLRYRVDPDAARTFNEPFVVAQEELHPDARGVFWHLVGLDARSALSRRWTSQRG